MITRTTPILLMLVIATAPAIAQVIYPTPEGIAASDLYEVQINGKPAFVYPAKVGDIYDEQGRARKDPPETTTAKPAAFCGFDMTEPVEITVRVKGAETLQTATIRPLRHGITPATKDSTIIFRITKPGQYSIEPNGSPIAPLLLFANPPEVNPPKAGNQNLLYFGPGQHMIGWTSIKPGQDVYLAPGAVVYGHLIMGNADGNKIYGRGILDSSRSPRKGDRSTSNQFGRRDVQIHVGHCKSVTIEGITLIDSPAWTLHVLNSTDIHIRNIKIITWRENGDGIDVNNSQRVTVEDSFLRTWDDALVVKATLAPPLSGKFKARDAKWTPDDLPRYAPGLVRDITFDNCVVWLDRAHALEIGFETNGTEIANVIFRNIDIIHDNHLAPIDITNGDRAIVKNILYENIRIEDSRSPVQINFMAGKCYTSIDNQMGLDYGPIENVALRSIEFFGDNRPRIAIEGQSIHTDAVEAKVRGIVVDNLKHNGKIVAEADLSIERKGLVAPLRFDQAK
jgi:hypothetical protein